MFIWRDQGKKKGKMQLENQSAGNFKSWHCSCYNFFDQFFNGHQTGSLIKLALPVPYCMPNTVGASTQVLKYLPLLDLHLLHSCLYISLHFVVFAAGPWLITSEEQQHLSSTYAHATLSVRNSWYISLQSPFLTLSSQQIFLLFLILWWDLTSWIIFLLSLPSYYRHV